ncbi:phosphatidate cytidylyltransferase [Ammonifex thiophilus]|uniref:Phosphatidate cytidylyltransferase n=1 Tax=Ammonifex thiophilus TaxID=444093 RepID=A0A3D8P2E5_9THEO|nr:phosphatidate cytidylyltransferase [Ammonifex thiophilus]RDV82428.1 phosphatidate cytidylyltransferase [Ammonifex thiophilus]
MPLPRELSLRVLSAVLGAPLILLLGWWGGWPFFLFLTLLYLLGLREMALLLRIPPLWPWINSIFFIWAAQLGRPNYELAVLPAAICTALALVFLFPRFSPWEAAATLFSCTYLSLLLFPFFLRSLPNGWFWLLFLLLITWTFDTVAYFTGRLWGRRRLVAQLSPGKTVEGSVGGLLASGGLSLLFAPWLGLSPLSLFLLGLGVGGAAQLGDLVLSAVKRASNKKDAGSLIPGHGGVLDRFDSLCLSAPLVYYFAYWHLGG